MLIEEVEKKAEKGVLERQEWNQEDDLREIAMKQIRLQELGNLFKSRPEWNDELKQLKSTHVIKTPLILQSLMYLLGFTREQICVPKTNQLFWKKARAFIDKDVPSRMAEFNIITEKNGEYKAYQTLNFCETVLQKHSEEDLSAYNSAVLKLFRWLKTAVEGRKAYITRTKALLKRAKENRATLVQQAEDRAKNREAHLTEMQEKFAEEHKDEIAAYEAYEALQKKKENDEYGDEQGSNEEAEEEKEPPVNPRFDEAEVLARFDEENPEVVIPAEVAD